MLRAAAERAGCDIVLARADVHETWSASEPDRAGPWYGRSRSRWDGDGDDDDFDGDFGEDGWAPRGARSPVDGDDYELDELVDWGITLDAWVTPSGNKAEPIATAVADNEVCATTPSGDLRPYASEYGGYMGNYGNTLDRWYRRAAVVVWPRQRAFTVRAEASPAWALDALSARLRRKDIAEAQAMAASLAPFWARVAGGEQRRGFLTKTLRVAGGLQEPDLAAMLLRPFGVELLAPSHAPALASLDERYGQDWAADLIAVWFTGRRAWAPPGSDRPAWSAASGRAGADSDRWRLSAEVDRRPFLVASLVGLARTAGIPDAPHRDDCSCWSCGGMSLTAPAQHHDGCVCWTCDPPRWCGDRRRRLLHVLRRQREIYDAQNSRIGVYDLLPYARKVGLDWLVRPGS